MFKNIIRGVHAYFSAFELLNKLKLWKYFAIPVLISLFTAFLIGIVAYVLSSSIGGIIASFWMFQIGKELVLSASNFVGGFLLLILGLLMYRHIVMAFSAPFMSPVSEKIEKYYTGNITKSSSFSVSLFRAIKINVRNLFKELLYTIPLLFLTLIPVIGILFVVLIFLIQAYYAGFGNMDYTLERHFKYNESINFVKNNKGVAIGNGIVFMLLLMLPFIGVLIVLPLSVVAASTITIKQIHQVK